MLRYVLTDVNGQATSFFKPVSMNIVTSLDAPADSFKASFYVSGEIPVINSAAVPADQGGIHIQIRSQPAVRIIQKRHDLIQPVTEIMKPIELLLFAFGCDRFRDLIFTGPIQPGDESGKQNVLPCIFCSAKAAKQTGHVFIIRILVDSPDKPAYGSAAWGRFAASAFETRDIGR